ncbi:MAG: hypothetical protein AABZ74_10445 [Cyanobacteriota bacterium]
MKINKLFGIILSFIILFTSCNLPNPNSPKDPKVLSTGEPLKEHKAFFDKSFNIKSSSCDQIYIRLYNSDDDSHAFVNGVEVATANYNNPSQKINITKFFNEGSNTIEFKTYNDCKDCSGSSPYGWGYSIYINDQEFFKDEYNSGSAKKPDNHTLVHSASKKITVNYDCKVEPECDNSSEKKITPDKLIDGDIKSGTFGTKNFIKSSFKTKAFTSDDIIEHLSYLVDATEKTKVLKDKIAILMNNGDTVQVDSLNPELIEAINERDLIKYDVLDGLNDYKSKLRAKVNFAMEDPIFSVDSLTKPTDLQEYESKILALDGNFREEVKKQNTVSLTKSLSFLADEVKLLADLVDDYTIESPINNSFSIAPFSNMGIKEDKTSEVVKYISKSISHNKDLFDLGLRKIVDNQEKLSNSLNDIQIQLNQIKKDLGIFDSFTTQAFHTKFDYTILVPEITFYGFGTQITILKKVIHQQLEAELKVIPPKTEKIDFLKENDKKVNEIEKKVEEVKKEDVKDTQEVDCNKKDLITQTLSITPEIFSTVKDTELNVNIANVKDTTSWRITAKDSTGKRTAWHGLEGKGSGSFKIMSSTLNEGLGSKFLDDGKYFFEMVLSNPSNVLFSNNRIDNTPPQIDDLNITETDTDLTLELKVSDPIINLVNSGINPDIAKIKINTVTGTSTFDGTTIKYTMLKSSGITSDQLSTYIEAGTIELDIEDNVKNKINGKLEVITVDVTAESISNNLIPKGLLSLKQLSNSQNPLIVPIFCEKNFTEIIMKTSKPLPSDALAGYLRVKVEQISGQKTGIPLSFFKDEIRIDFVWNPYTFGYSIVPANGILGSGSSGIWADIIKTTSAGTSGNVLEITHFYNHANFKSGKYKFTELSGAVYDVSLKKRVVLLRTKSKSSNVVPTKDKPTDEIEYQNCNDVIGVIERLKAKLDSNGNIKKQPPALSGNSYREKYFNENLENDEKFLSHSLANHGGTKTLFDRQGETKFLSDLVLLNMVLYSLQDTCLIGEKKQDGDFLISTANPSLAGEKILFGNKFTGTKWEIIDNVTSPYIRSIHYTFTTKNGTKPCEIYSIYPRLLQ